MESELVNYLEASYVITTVTGVVSIYHYVITTVAGPVSIILIVHVPEGTMPW